MGFVSKRLGLQFVLIYFLALFRILQALQFQTALQLIHSIVPLHAIVHVIVSILTYRLRLITVARGLGSFQNMENEVNLLLPLGSKS